MLPHRWRGPSGKGQAMKESCAGVTKAQQGRLHLGRQNTVCIPQTKVPKPNRFYLTLIEGSDFKRGPKHNGPSCQSHTFHGATHSLYK